MAKQHFNLIFCFFSLTCILSYFTGSTALFDSSDYIVNILFKLRVVENFDYRDIAFFILQTPAALVRKYISQDFFSVGAVFQLSHVLIPLIAIGLNHFLLKDQDKKLSYFVTLGLMICYFFSFYCHVSELHIAVVFLLISISSLFLTPNRYTLLAFFISFIISNGSYPIAMFAIPAIVFLVYKKANWKIKHYLFIAITMLSSILFQIKSMQNYKLEYQQGHNSFYHAFQNPVIYIMAALFGIFLIYLFIIYCRNFKRKSFLTILALVPLILFLYHKGWPAPWMHYAGRGFSVLFTLGFIYLFIILYRLKPSFIKVDLFNIAKNMIIPSIMILLFYNVNFYFIKKDFVSRLNIEKGIVSYQDALEKGLQPHTFSSDHTLINLSLFWQKNGYINSVINNKSSSYHYAPDGVEKYLLRLYYVHGLPLSKAFLDSLLKQ